MDEIKIYKYCIDETFINNLYNSGHTSNTLLSIDNKIYLSKTGIIEPVFNILEIGMISNTLKTNNSSITDGLIRMTNKKLIPF